MEYVKCLYENSIFYIKQYFHKYIYYIEINGIIVAWINCNLLHKYQ